MKETKKQDLTEDQIQKAKKIINQREQQRKIKQQQAAKELREFIDITQKKYGVKIVARLTRTEISDVVKNMLTDPRQSAADVNILIVPGET